MPAVGPLVVKAMEPEEPNYEREGEAVQAGEEPAVEHQHLHLFRVAPMFFLFKIDFTLLLPTSLAMTA
jgi:hypothetical protein